MRATIVAFVASLSLVACAGVGEPADTVDTREPAIADGGTMSAIVSTRNIQAGQPLDPLIDDGVFTEVEVPRDMFTETRDPVVDLSQLRGKTASEVIREHELISLEHVT